jgi:hypothetical protein
VPPRHVENDTRRRIPPRCGENMNNDTARKWVPPRCVENGKNGVLITSKTTRGGGYLLGVVKPGITTQRGGGYLLAASRVGRTGSSSRRKQHEEVGTSSLRRKWEERSPRHVQNNTRWVPSRCVENGPRHVENGTRRWVPPRCGENRNNDNEEVGTSSLCRKWEERGGGYLLAASRTSVVLV